MSLFSKKLKNHFFFDFFALKKAKTHFLKKKKKIKNEAFSQKLFLTTKVLCPNTILNRLLLIRLERLVFEKAIKIPYKTE